MSVLTVHSQLPALPSVAAAAASTEATAITQTVTFATIKTQLYLNVGTMLVKSFRGWSWLTCV